MSLHLSHRLFFSFPHSHVFVCLHSSHSIPLCFSPPCICSVSPSHSLLPLSISHNHVIICLSSLSLLLFSIPNHHIIICLFVFLIHCFLYYSPTYCHLSIHVYYSIRTIFLTSMYSRVFHLCHFLIFLFLTIKSSYIFQCLLLLPFFIPHHHV